MVHSSPAPSPSPSPRVENPQVNYSFKYDFIDVVKASEAEQQDELAVKDPRPRTLDLNDGETFEFRLFASPPGTTSTNADSSGTKTKAKVKLLPTPEILDVPISEGRFLGPARSETHYFTSSLTSSLLYKLRREYFASAVSSQDILQKALSQAWPGTALPWRVTHIASSKATSIPGTHSPGASAQTVPVLGGGSRKKPNKKRRIQLRRLMLARTAAANARVRQTETAEEKEKALREKKTAKNRKIQLKRREKERQKKAEAKAAGGTKGGELSEQAYAIGSDEENSRMAP